MKTLALLCDKDWYPMDDYPMDTLDVDPSNLVTDWWYFFFEWKEYLFYWETQ
jgi:hypothetical protein